MESLENWLQRKYLEWQRDNGLGSIKAFAKFLGLSYTTLLTIFNGDRDTTSMSTAYQIGERLNDFSILELLGYPAPMMMTRCGSQMTVNALVMQG